MMEPRASPPLKLPDDPALRALFKTPRGKPVVNRWRFNQPVALYPNLDGEPLTSINPRILRVHAKLTDLLSDRFTTTIDENGFAGANAVIGNFYAGRSVSGFGMDPATTPPVSNRRLMSENSIVERFRNPRDERIFTTLVKVLFGHIIPVSMPLRKEASFGAPYFSSDLVLKKRANTLFNEHAETIIDNALRGDHERNYNDYRIMNLTYCVARRQADKVIRTKDGTFHSKDREVNDERYARTAGAEGRRFIADKTIRWNGRVIEGHFAFRDRIAYGYPWPANGFFSQILTSHAEYYLNRFAFTFKHRGSSDIESKITDWPYIYGGDVHQFDQSVPVWAIDAWIDRLPWVDKLKAYLKLLLRQPFLEIYPYVRSGPPYDPLFGRPFDGSSYTNELGLPSGQAINPHFGKFYNTFAHLCLFADIGITITEESIIQILTGVHPDVMVMSQSDDVVFGFKKRAVALAFKKRLATGAEFYVKIALEEGISFLGSVLYHDQHGAARACPNVGTFITNWVAAEHGIGLRKGARREFFATGWFERQRHYSRAPLFAEVMEIWNEVWYTEFGWSINTQFNEALKREKREGVPTLSDIDLAVLEDPARLFYRYTLDEVSEWVRDRVVSIIPLESFEHNLRKFTKV